MARVSSWLVIASLVFCSSQASAQEDEAFSLDDPEEEAGETEVASPEEAAKSPSGPVLLGDEQALQEERSPEEQFRETTDPYEDPSKRYYFVGAGWRFASLPSWLLGAVQVETEANLVTPATFFAEAAFRRKGFQIGVNVGYLKWNFDDAFRLSDDDVLDTEWLETRFNFLITTATITWSTAFTDWFQLEYGLEAGLAFLFNSRMTRSEAFKRDDGSWGKCETWAPQDGFRNPSFRSYQGGNDPTREEEDYCDVPLGESDDARPPDSNPADEVGAHYGVDAKRGVFNSGVPHVVPVLGPRVSLRFKPLAQLVLRVDVPLPVIPFGIMGGVSAQYGF